MNTDTTALLTLLATKGLGPKTLRTLKASFATWEELLTASDRDLAVAGARSNHITAIHCARNAHTPHAQGKLHALYAKHNIDVITENDKSYPRLLREVPDAPLALFVRGHCDALLHEPFVTIVGAREHTSYGERATYRLAYDLASAGVNIVSGLARGIDAIAHRAALDAHGTTVGVLGGSIDDAHIAPRQNHRLAHAIMESGALISEYPLFTEPTPYTFPARNRIMAAMAHITLVIEAAAKSGTLITAHTALEYNRDVCAVPGSIFSDVSVGTHALIRNGAKIVTCAQDVLAELPHNHSYQYDIATTSQSVSCDTPDEERIFSLLSAEPLHVDKITAMSKLETTRVLSALSLLEIKGMIRNVGGQHYIRVQK